MVSGMWMFLPFSVDIGEIKVYFTLFLLHGIWMIEAKRVKSTTMCGRREAELHTDEFCMFKKLGTSRFCFVTALSRFNLDAI